MTALVFLAFAAHVVAWLLLPEGKTARTARKVVRASHAVQPSGI